VGLEMAVEDGSHLIRRKLEFAGSQAPAWEVMAWKLCFQSFSSGSRSFQDSIPKLELGNEHNFCLIPLTPTLSWREGSRLKRPFAIGEGAKAKPNNKGKEKT
jgi:hypothetical protein